MKNDIAAAYEALIAFLYQVPIGLVQTELDGSITMINPMSAQLLMPLAVDGNLVNLFDVLMPVAPQLRNLTAAFDADEGAICETHVQVGSPPARTLSLKLVKLGPAVLMASVADVTAVIAKQQADLASQLDIAAHTDPLTAMPNRAAVRERLARLLDSGRQSFALLFLNCDRFTRINDSHGRAIGDELLCLIAERLNRSLRQRDAVGRTRTAARLGSDEFVLLLEDLRHNDDAHGIAQRLLDVLGEPYRVGPHLVHVTVSVGVVMGGATAELAGRDTAAGGDSDAAADAVLQNASIAMHEAKRLGGARHSVFEPAMGERAARRGSIETELRRALSDGELFVVYQPVVDLRDGSTAGVEALVRWRHPSRGVVMPGEFIEVAEETGLICALGDFVLNVACHQFVNWQNKLGALAPRLLAVNLSRAQLAEDSLAQQVRHALRRSGMPAACLQLEITESLAAQDAQVQERLHELKAIGLSLALDDFGTGYSSLSSLHLLPLDVVKIDRSFVTLAESSPHHRVLVEATVRVATSLGMSTVAEGIETEGQASVLRELRCDKGQGYLFAKPMRADDAARWLAGRGGRAIVQPWSQPLYPGAPGASTVSTLCAAPPSSGWPRSISRST